MTSFDATVLDWLRRSGVDKDKKDGVLALSEKSIMEYKQMAAPPQDAGKSRAAARPRLAVDYTLLDEIARQRAGDDTGRHWDPTGEETAALGASASGRSPLSPGTQKAFKSFGFGDACVVGEEDDAADADEEEDGLAKSTEVDASQHAAAVKAYGRGNQKYGGRRKTVSAEVINMESVEGYEPPQHDKSEADTQWLLQRLGEEFLFEHLEDFELEQVVRAIFVRECVQGDQLFVEGEEGDTFFVLQEGTVQVTESEIGSDAQIPIEDAGPGWVRGEEDLMYGAEAYQNVTITSESARVFCLQREPYRYMVTKASMKKREMYCDFLSKISFLHDMSTFERNQVADALKPVNYAVGDKMISFGDEGAAFFIIVEGTVTVFGRHGEEAGDPVKEVCEFSVGDCVGELEFIFGHKCVADVVAKTEVRAARMGKRHFEKVMGACEDLLRERASEDPKFEHYRAAQARRGASPGDSPR